LIPLQVLDSLADSLLMAVEAAEVVPPALAGTAAAHGLLSLSTASSGRSSPALLTKGPLSSPAGKSPVRPQISFTAKAGLPPSPGRVVINAFPGPRGSPGAAPAQQQRPAPPALPAVRVSPAAAGEGATPQGSGPVRKVPAPHMQQTSKDWDYRRKGRLPVPWAFTFSGIFP
jgi:hypothetical protein